MRLLLDENNGWCCGAGTKRHKPWPEIPSELARIMDERPQKFSDLSRVFNSLFCSAVLHAGSNEEGFSYHVSNGPPCMRFSGNLYARLMRTSQHCWFLNDARFAVAYRSLSSNDKQIVRNIASVLIYHNSCAAQMWNLNPRVGVLHSSTDVSEGSVVFCDDPDKATVCVLYVGPSTLPPPRKLCAAAILGSGQLLDEDHPLWEVLLYPLFHPTGSTSTTWRNGLLPMRSSSTRRRKSLTLREYVRSVMLFEPRFWTMGRLAQQFVLDGWSRAEQMCIRVWKSETVQKKIREAVRRITSQEVSKDKIFLPPSVPGSRRYQERFIHDGMYITSVYGNPHIFLTMTANPSWPEITVLLPKHQNASDRPDIVARVFHQRRKYLLHLLRTPNFLFDGHLGIDFIISATEFQLCGLPHWHAAVRLTIDYDKVPMKTTYDHLQLMDRLISAKIPPEGFNRDLVHTFMMHQDPCDGRCSRKRKDGTFGCRFYFPKEENHTPRVDKKGFPVYRRDSQDSRVVPHILPLLRELECHVDAEWCFGSSSIGYLYKYFSKCADSTGVKIIDENDEIAAYRSARILTCSESVYRTLEYDINIRSPAVVLCRFSVPRRHDEPDDSDLVAAEEYMLGNPDEISPATGEVVDAENECGDLNGNLDEYFDRPPECEDLLFNDFFASYYIQKESTIVTFQMRQRMYLDLRGRYWIRRTQTQGKMLARMPVIPIYAGEAYYLRMLLSEIPARSYSDLYGGFSTFRQNAESMGLFQSPVQNVNALLEAIEEKLTSYDFRRLYVLMLFYCGEMTGTWNHNEIRKHLRHDFLPESRRSEDWSDEVADILCTMHMCIIAQQMHREIFLEDFGIPPPPESLETLTSLLEVAPAHGDLIKEYAELTGLNLHTRTRATDHTAEISRYQKICTETAMQNRIGSLWREQREAFDIVVEGLTQHQAKCLHIDAPAGCGKTYLCQTIVMYARSQSVIALTCATTGIAALHYVAGQTAHSLFRLPLKPSPDVLEGDNFESALLSVLRKQNGTGTNNRIELLRASPLIIWDEICMSHKRLFEAVDKLFRKIMRVQLPFGGKIVVTLGDWRQVCPVESDRDSILRRRTSENQTAFATSAFNTTILSSPLWSLFRVLRLTENIRQKNDTQFHEKLLLIGNGLIGERIPLTSLGVETTTDYDKAISWLFESHEAGSDPYKPEFCHERAFISPFNSDVDTVNEWIIDRMCAMRKLNPTIMKAVDSEVREGTNMQTDVNAPREPRDMDIETRVRNMENALLSVELNEIGNEHSLDDVDPTGHFFQSVQNQTLTADMFSPEILRKQYFDGIPQAELHLIPGMIVILLRNIDPSRRLMNGVRLEVVRVRRHVVIVRHVGESQEHVIPRIKFDVTVGADNLHFTRSQVPLRAAYSCTIHKSQASTLNRVVVDLRNGVFDHGQLYVALSRVRLSQDILILVAPDQQDVLNIVHDIILRFGGVK